MSNMQQIHLSCFTVKTQAYFIVDTIETKNRRPEQCAKIFKLIRKSNHCCFFPVTPATTSLNAGCGTCLDDSKESSMGLTTAGRKRPKAPIRQEAATTGSCATNILSFSITAIFSNISRELFWVFAMWVSGCGSVFILLCFWLFFFFSFVFFFKKKKKKLAVRKLPGPV